MNQAAAGLGRRCIQQVGPDRGGRVNAEQEISSGVISEPPPTPVIPTSRPTPNPDAT
jgi:hypothetical protein